MKDPGDSIDFKIMKPALSFKTLVCQPHRKLKRYASEEQPARFYLSRSFPRGPYEIVLLIGREHRGFPVQAPAQSES